MSRRDDVIQSMSNPGYRLTRIQWQARDWGPRWYFTEEWYWTPYARVDITCPEKRIERSDENHAILSDYLGALPLPPYRERTMKLSIYSLETGVVVDQIDGATNDACEREAYRRYGTNDFGWTYCDVEIGDSIDLR